ncbi:enhanced serine sensitivity protein SseB, partial [Listeria monocytogenes]|nr:enhanced serine sensitivity protein SseB [Listeria monocytogenes]
KQVEEELYRQMQKSKLLLPAIIREENKISIVKIIDEKENEYLPVFTDWTNFQLYLDSTKESQPIVFTFNEYFNILVADLNLSGIVINPYSHNLVLSRENLNYLEKSQVNIQKGEQISIGLPKKYPHLFVENCKSFFEKDSSIKSAFLLQMVRDNQISLLLVIDTPNIEVLFSKLNEYTEKFLDSEQILDILALDTPLGKNTTKEYEPFYKRKG